MPRPAAAIDEAAKSRRRSRSRSTSAKAVRTLPWARAAARSAPVSRTEPRIRAATTTAGIPTAAIAAGQPNDAMTQAPTRGTATVPRFPPAMCTAIAAARARAGRCSAISALPTGCCGDPATRDTIVPSEKAAHDEAKPVAAMAAPKARPPIPRSERRLTTRWRGANASWITPLRMLPTASRRPISPTPIPKIGVMAMKTSGRRAVWAWMKPCWAARSPRVRRGRRWSATGAAWSTP